MRGSVLLLWIAGLLTLFTLTAAPAGAVNVTLKGSPESMHRQHDVATDKGYSFVETSDEVKKLVEKNELVPLQGNADYVVLESVSFPYARPEVRLFIERLAAEYREATREKLVVTSLTRPSENQPWNAHALSVHPAGLAVDLRVSDNAGSRAWLESVLLKLEKQGLLDATRERRPPHYHIAVFPEAYLSHVETLIGPGALATALLWGDAPEAEEAAPAAEEPVAKAQAPAAAAPAKPSPRETPAAAALPLILVLMGGAGYWFARKTGTQVVQVLPLEPQADEPGLARTAETAA